MVLQPKRSPGKRASVGGGRSVLVGKVSDRYEALLTGELSLDDLDDEEILRGQLRAKDGSFKGRPPKLIPREMGMELARRQKVLIEQELAGLVLTALKTLDDIMKKKHPQPGDAARVNAAKEILARNLGKVPETVNLKAEISTWEKKVEAVTVVYELPEPKEIEQ